ncbi:MAG: cadmium-translocating P-type ATPase [Clostridiales bacterium]|nr:cadmium-translocating P-type ATPase [Clostridiales bacterium]
MNKKQKKMLLRILITAVMLVGLQFLPLTGIPRLAGYVAAYLVIGYDILKKAGKGILNGRAFDENFLMAIATLGAFFLAVWTKSGDYLEGIAVMLFYQIGELFQSYAVGKSRRNISALMDIRPDYANIEVDGKLEQVDPDEVTVGSIIVVQPGEKVPLDGIVVSGGASLNTSALTGESLPRDVKEGDGIISGCIDMNGLLKVQTTKEFGESTVSKILDLVENASSRKSKSEAFISRFAKVYTPAVCIAAVLLGILLPVIRLVLGLDAQWVNWIYRALTFLVVSCPCALVISIPLSFFAGIGCASKEGILIKGSNYLEALSGAKYVVFDKTGTLTQGVFEVTGVHHNAMEEAKLLEYAALAECASSHPISKSLQKAYGKEIDRSRVEDIEEISGHGITAKVDGHSVAAGNGKLMKKLGLEYHDCHCVGTIIHVAIDGAYAGHIVISDVVKPHSKDAIAALKKSGVEKTVMLTGDAKKVADQVAAQLGVDEVRSELLPADKVSEVEKLLQEKGSKGVLAFVGDGINDAPVLTRADIGIAMGAMGSDAAIEAADVVLMDDDPLQIAKAIKISRKCIGIVRQNIVFSLIVKFGCLALTALGYADMWAAIFADVGVMVLAVLNAIRALKYRG